MGAKKVNLVSLSLRFIIGFTWLSLWSLVSIILMIIFLPFRNLRIRLGNFTGKIIGPFITRITGTKVNYSNYDKIHETKPAIYVMNHASALDIFVGMALCPYGACGVGKKEIIKIPFFGLVYWLSGHLLIDRSNREKAIDYKQGKEKLFGFFVGQAMKASGGKANPQLINEILKKKLQ